MIEKIKFTAIELPIINQEVQVLAKEAKELEGKTICLDLTRNLKGKSVEAIFKLNVQGDKILATLNRLHILPFYIRRMIRKAIDYVEDSFEAISKDSKLRVKPFFITRKKVHRSVRKALRNKAKEEILSYTKEKNTSEIFSDLLNGIFQKSLSIKLKKTYPLSFCDIQDIFIVKESTIQKV
jgi:ribosomal protein S3AE